MERVEIAGETLNVVATVIEERKPPIVATISSCCRDLVQRGMCLPRVSLL